MLARVAEDLFWMSRFVERAISVARIIDVTVHLELDDGEAGEPDSARGCSGAPCWARR